MNLYYILKKLFIDFRTNDNSKSEFIQKSSKKNIIFIVKFMYILMRYES